MRVLLLVLSVTLWQEGFCGGRLDSLVHHAVKVSLVRLAQSIDEVRDSTLYPTYGTPQLAWKLGKSDDWTSGFYPGCLWYAYDLSHDPRFEQWARRWTASIEQEKFNSETHDLGFKFFCSFGNGFRLGKGPAYDRYRDIILSAATTLAERYSRKVGCLESNWDRAPSENSFPVIIDIMMNLEILFWASQHGGPSSLADIAHTHALTTRRDFIRPDGGTYHIVRYDKNTGRIINKGTLQGAGDETTWARGQAWGLYGMVTAYRYTGDRQLLAAAFLLCDYFLQNLPDNHVSAWDFQSAIHYRDVSATAIAVSALFALIHYAGGDSLQRRYNGEAEAMLTSLCSAPYFAEGVNTNCLLDHSVQYLPLNSNVDVPAIFADYYFLEALLRYRAFHPAGIQEPAR